MMILAGCLFLAAALFAQPQGQKRSEEQRKKGFDRIHSEKVAFITSELDLTPEEAQDFWPVYNQCWKEAAKAYKSRKDAFSEFRGKKAADLSEKELEKKVDAYIEASKASAQILYEWYPKFKKVLPIRKVAKLYQAEENFQQHMIRNLREQPHRQNAEKKMGKPAKTGRPQVEPKPEKGPEIQQ